MQKYTHTHIQFVYSVLDFLQLFHSLLLVLYSVYSA